VYSTEKSLATSIFKKVTKMNEKFRLLFEIDGTLGVYSWQFTTITEGTSCYDAFSSLFKEECSLLPVHRDHRM